MNTNDLNTALYEKMAAEQDKYRDWLKSQPPEEILHHTYEYTVREDIVMAMEELELTDAQAQALLESPSPLADVYRYYLRKMALDGYVVKLDLPELKELVSLMRRSSNNLNQLTRKVHETGRVYDADLEDISQRQEQLWEGVSQILTQLSKLS